MLQLLKSGRSMMVRHHHRHCHHHHHRQHLLRHSTTSCLLPPSLSLPSQASYYYYAIRHYGSTQFTLQRHYTGNNPFRVLGIPTNSSVKTAQKAFVKLAIQHHPDTNENNNTDKNDASVHHFVRIRQAFEKIRDGAKFDSAEYNDDNDDNGDELHPAASWTEQDFLQWFFEQTGLRLTSDQRRELVNLYRSRVPGGRYDGPSWEIARRLVTEQDAFLRQKYQHQNGGGGEGGKLNSSSFRSASSSSSSSSFSQRASASSSSKPSMRRKRKR